jgi:hypothetical protein
MNEDSRSFRESRITLLKFFASAEEQQQFQLSSCHSDGYAYDEFSCWWADDFHPDSALFRAAFNANEIAILQRFNEVFESALAKIGARVANVEQLLCNASWQKVIAAAESAYVALES